MQRRLARSIEIMIHLLIWSVIFILLLLNVKTLGSFNKEDGSIYIALSYGLLSNLALFYVNALYLIPKYIPGLKIKRYIIWVLAIFSLITLIESLLDRFVFVNLYSSEEESLGSLLLLNSVINGLIISLSVGYGFIKNWIINENQKQKLLKEKLSAELNFLRAQVNPHFLFNTLNMAYASAIKHGDETTSDIIEKLSDLLRYNLYESNGSKVELRKELDYIESYISLQTKRLSDDIKQHLEIKIDKVASEDKIAPLILIPFIENVFKHGIIVSSPGKIEIKIELKNKNLKLFTKNPRLPDKEELNYGGIGIKNVKARLELLYQDKYKLVNRIADGNYITELSLQL